MYAKTHLGFYLKNQNAAFYYNEKQLHYDTLLLETERNPL